MPIRTLFRAERAASPAAALDPAAPAAADAADLADRESAGLVDDCYDGSAAAAAALDAEWDDLG